MKLLVAGLVVCTALFLAACGAPPEIRSTAPDAAPFTLTVLHINDHHGHLEARPHAVVTNSFIAGGGDGYAVFARASAEGSTRDTFAEYAQSFVNHVRVRTEAGEPLMGPVQVRMSTRRFINADGCGHARRPDCS